MKKMAITLALAGDIMLRNVQDPGKPFTGKNRADVIFGNLEGCLHDSDGGRIQRESPPPKEISQSPPLKSRRYDAGTKAAPLLAEMGLNAIGCANNVTYGADAISSSLDLLDKMNIVHTGAGQNRHSARAPAIIKKNDATVGFVQYTSTYYPIDHEASDKSAGVATVKAYTAYQPHQDVLQMPGAPANTITWADAGQLEAMSEDIKRLSKKVDITVASYHWGVGLEIHPTQYQTEIAHAAIDAGADLVIGHGPHVVQPIEIYLGKTVFYGLGDFVTRNQRVGLVAWVEIDGGIITHISCSPVTHDPETGRTIIRSAKTDSSIVKMLLETSLEFGAQLQIKNGRLIVDI